MTTHKNSPHYVPLREAYLSDTGNSLEYYGPIRIEVSWDAATKELLREWAYDGDGTYNELLNRGYVYDDEPAGDMTEAGIDAYRQQQRQTLSNILDLMRRYHGAEIVGEPEWIGDGLNLRGELYGFGGGAFQGWMRDNASDVEQEGDWIRYDFSAEAMDDFSPEGSLFPLWTRMQIQVAPNMWDEETWPEDEWQQGMEKEWKGKPSGGENYDMRKGPGIEPYYGDR